MPGCKPSNNYNLHAWVNLIRISEINRLVSTLFNMCLWLVLRQQMRTKMTSYEWWKRLQLFVHRLHATPGSANARLQSTTRISTDGQREQFLPTSGLPVSESGGSVWRTRRPGLASGLTAATGRATTITGCTQARTSTHVSLTTSRPGRRWMRKDEWVRQWGTPALANDSAAGTWDTWASHAETTGHRHICLQCRTKHLF